jgi:DNA-binding IclR family transcriptional regulator
MPVNTAANTSDKPREVPYVQTLSNGLRIVEALKDGPQSRAELQQRTGIERSAVYRLLRTLEAHGFVSHSSDGRYRLGLYLWELGAAARGDPDLGLTEASSPLIRQLAEEFGESVHLSVYNAGDTVYIDKAEGSHPIRSYTRLGGRAPAYCVATGKALLAHQPEEEQKRVADGSLERFTDKTITSPRRLMQELAGIRQAGFALNRGEWRSDVGGVAAAIIDVAGDPVAALGFSGPLQRIEERREELISALWSACRRLRAELRWEDHPKRD